MTKRFTVPDEWGLSEQQEVVLGSLLDAAGEFVAPIEFVSALYDDEVEPGMAAPAKLRVLVQRCRAILDEQSKGKVKIITRRNLGWKISSKGRLLLQKIVDKV